MWKETDILVVGVMWSHCTPKINFSALLRTNVTLIKKKKKKGVGNHTRLAWALNQCDSCPSRRKSLSLPPSLSPSSSFLSFSFSLSSLSLSLSLS